MLVWALIVLSASRAYGRAVDDVDNSIQSDRETNLINQKDWVRIHQPPPAKITQSLGAPAELVCEVVGSPVPSVKWVQGEAPLEEDESLESNAIIESSPNAIVKVRSVLVIDHLLPSDKAFTCLGRNGVNRVSASTIVHPEYQSKMLSELLIPKSHGLAGPQKPKIVFSYSQYMDLMGSTVVLPCKAIGRPRPEIYWLDVQQTLITDRKRYKILPNGYLLITDLKWDDMGTFTCIARNSFGKDTISTFVYSAAKE